MAEATARDYWISATALYIELNALGDPDYIQASCVNDTKVLAFMKGIDALEYDAGHNYRRWSLQASPTVFNSHSEKYVYIAVPRDPNTNKGAFVAFPSEKIDLYGLNKTGEQIGSTSYYYIFTQGVISSSGTDGRTSRVWVTPVNTGTLSSDEAVKAATGDGTWWEWNAVSNCVKFLKDISEATISVLTLGKLKFNGSVINGVANDSTTSTADDALVTPNWGDAHYLSSVNEDTAVAAITFAKGAKFGENTDYSISEAGAAKLATAAISDSVGNGDFVSGYAAGKGWSVYSTLVNNIKKWTLEIDNLVVRSAMKVYEMVISQLLGENDNRVFTAMAEVDAYNGRNWVYVKTEGGKITAPFRVGDWVECQQFNADGENLIKHYRTIVTSVTQDTSGEMTRQRLNVNNGVKFTDLTGNGGKAKDLIAVGDTLVRVDNASDESRKGIVGITSVGENTPYIDVIYGKTTETNPLKVRMGNLSGVTDENFGGVLSGWGLYAENAYLKGQVHADSGYFKGEIQATSGTFENGTFTKCTSKEGTFEEGTFNKGTFTDITAVNGTFDNGTFTNANVSGTINAYNGSIGGFVIKGSGLYVGGDGESCKADLGTGGICFYKSDGSKTTHTAEFGTDCAGGGTYLQNLRHEVYGAAVGLNIDMRNRDVSYGDTVSTDNFDKIAIQMQGGSIAGLKIHTKLMTSTAATSEANPEVIGMDTTVAVVKQAKTVALPNFGQKTQYDGHVVIVKNLAGDNQIAVQSQGNNIIQAVDRYVTRRTGYRFGDAAMFIFVPLMTRTQDGTEYKGVWIECAMGRDLD